MGRKPGQTRQRMVGAAVELLRERGASAVTVDAVLARSGAPRGSVYHHFPGGRNELVLAAVRHAADYVTSRIDATVESGDPVQALDGFVRFWKKTLRDTDYLAGCPIVAVAIDAYQDPPEAAALAREVFGRWQTKLAGLLVNRGFGTARATRVATLMVAAVEGAVILCRARRDHTPLDDVRNELKPLLEGAGG
ncbi:TetR/AcrR family transcriptional regulator [Mycobacterium xenopi]|uniref:TetR-family transcriptional regulator n=2 Tax=Mycobacterium xenopi TaxID=1789 RepID=A0AAD1M144_MYCXE|nr:TetR/AcrR family transcriptional regulator [Mycobacterium xenopi]MDA3641667.1 TetR/AcrR family transcriptional regulator [Mycobacterium xenopi]MDA3660163.1 TetR/AcrR family transcriptional regulator [Mycobacterium xenopi]MDA3663893.1 TetR/AcrR family transcriptional regulator [Mycobacterium xenopi]SPX92683.1 transcriptional regulator [Mycobacterium xenopi]BBU22703.1 putative TetR-family transcriptional regulator [Mycobacterium xenopi]